MPSTPRLQTNRFELKYEVDEKTAAAVRDFVRGHLVPDAYTDPDQPLGYMVHSLYLDSPSYILAKATMNGEKNRFKLRIRYYDTKPNSPVFFEIKRRVNSAILKSRAAVKRNRVAALLRGRMPSNDDLFDPTNLKDLRGLSKFCQLRSEINAGPAAFTSYRREAYTCERENSARVTMDRELMGGDWTGDLHRLRVDDWRTPKAPEVVLELKFTHRFPMWMRELVRRFGLQRCSMPKYVECIRALRTDRLDRAGQLGLVAM